MFFSVITENLNWDILSKSLVIFKRDDMQLRIKNFKFKWNWWSTTDKSKVDQEKNWCSSRRWWWDYSHINWTSGTENIIKEQYAVLDFAE